MTIALHGRTRLMLLSVLVGTVACERGAAAPAPQAERPRDAVIDSLVHAEALGRGVPAVAVAIVADGRIVLQRAWGHADAATGRAATVATPFNIASVTKPFTSALILHLADEGKLALDDAARAHLPDLPERYRDITVRQLLTHTSGIARDLRLDNFDDPDAATYRVRLDSAAASATPADRYEYTNAGYTVLGWIVEAIEGLSLEEVLRRRIFEPAGMRQARYRAPLTEDPVRARPHDVTDGVARPIEYITGGFGSGGMSMSAADAAAFALALQDGRFVPEAYATAAWTPARLGNDDVVRLQMFGDEAGYGFGWFITRYAGRPMMTHGGGIEGYSANLYHFPAERLTVIVLANTKGRDDGTAPVDPLARRIADLCLAANACRLDDAEARLRTEISAAHRAFSQAYLAGDTAGIRTMYTPDALALPPDARAIAGSASIARLFRPARSNQRVDHALFTERLVRHDSALVELGTWYDSWVDNATGTPGTATGRYTLTWVRRQDSWRIAADTWVPAR